MWHEYLEIDLNARLRELGLSQNAAAKQLGVTRSAVNKYCQQGRIPKSSIAEMKRRGGDVSILGLEADAV